MNFRYIDIHTHVNIAAFSEDSDAVTSRTLSEGVAHINVGTQKATSARAVAIANEHENGVYATVGLHPVHTAKSYHDEHELGTEGKDFAETGEKFQRENYETFARDPKVVAIGECGLDYFRTETKTKEIQEEAFIAQILLANDLKKPLMLHIRDVQGSVGAYTDALNLLKAHAKVLGNVHFFAGTYDIAKQFWEIGYSTSFTGVITFANQYDETIQKAPLEMLHAETDAPYVAPKPFRGERNEPLHVREVYKRIAELRNEDEETVRLALIQNAERLFNIKL
jgi:TatD DNase family protein